MTRRSGVEVGGERRRRRPAWSCDELQGYYVSKPVSAYIAIISVMVASAIATRNVVAIAGAAIFMASDTLIAWNRFVRPLAWAPVTIMVTYHLAQTALVLSLLR